MATIKMKQLNIRINTWSKAIKYWKQAYKDVPPDHTYDFERQKCLACIEKAKKYIAEATIEMNKLAEQYLLENA